MISVVIPYYNRSHTIERCLTSVFNQTYKDIEIILVDDASTDWQLAEAKLKPFDQTRIRIIHHKQNRNGSAARNTGIKQAKGEYIALLDSDDEWYPDHLQNCLNSISANKNNDVLVFASINIYFGSPKNPGSRISPKLNEGEIEKVDEFLFVHEMPIQTSTFFMFTEFAKKNLFDEKLVRFQDIEYVLRINFNSAKIFQSKHIGAIVHWEGDTFANSLKKGRSADFALLFYEKIKLMISNKAATKFALYYVFTPLFYQYKFKKAFTLLSKLSLWKEITAKDYFRFASYMTIKRFHKIWMFVQFFKK